MLQLIRIRVYGCKSFFVTTENLKQNSIFVFLNLAFIKQFYKRFVNKIASLLEKVNNDFVGKAFQILLVVIIIKRIFGNS